MFLQIAGFPFFFNADNSLLYVSTIFSLSAYLLVDSWVVYPSYCEYCCKEHRRGQYLFKILISTLLDIYSEMELVDIW